MTKDEALALDKALEAQQIIASLCADKVIDSKEENILRAAINQALAAPVQEPVAAECKFDREQKWVRCEIAHHNLVQSEPQNWPGYQTRLLYTTPPAAQRQWVGLTTEDMATCIDEPAWDLVLRKAEQILKEKNT